MEFKEYKPAKAPVYVATKTDTAIVAKFVGMTVAGVAFFALLWLAALLDGAAL